MRGNRYAVLLLALVSPWVSAPALSAQAETQGLTPEEKRGKQIYFLGTSDSQRKIVARFGEALIKVPASALPCASCRGFDGRDECFQIHDDSACLTLLSFSGRAQRGPLQ